MAEHGSPIFTLTTVKHLRSNSADCLCIWCIQHNKLVRASWEAENARSPSARSPSRRAQRQLQRRQRKLNRPIGKDPTLDYGAGNGSFIVDQDSDGDSDFSSDDDTSPTESPTTPAVPSPNDSIVWYDNNGERKLVPRGSKGTIHLSPVFGLLASFHSANIQKVITRSGWMILWRPRHF